MDKPSWEVQEDLEEHLTDQPNPEGDWLLPADRDRPLDELHRHYYHGHAHYSIVDLAGCWPWLAAALALLALALALWL